MNYDDPQAGFVSGDWCWDDDAKRYANVYPARLTGTWNGWACPSFDRATAQRVTDDQHAVNAQMDEVDSITFRWNGDTLTTVPEPNWYLSREDYAVDGKLKPAALNRAKTEAWREATTASGPRYAIGDGWCWTRCNADGTPYDGANPAAPTEAQCDAFKRYNERAFFGTPRNVSTGAIHSYSMSVRADGTHSFPLHVWTGTVDPEHPTRWDGHHVGNVVIARDGKITLEAM